ncbi:MAG: bifunctional phosphopantothenoylcysteine decarboxylase/phosphopantothenate--cysteine ligase CoaBC [Dehalococcoidales bacterium]|nr:bifunctional phosphopantothenoylcysteine decarboxylase/phosphopantothenate--cysteine ligase CoaBC [Dehalococcoidales bacterium]
MLKKKIIVLGVTGGIAVYKVADLASKLTQSGADVHVVMTKSATEFVTPTTFEALTGNTVVTEMFGPRASHDIAHIKLADAADLMVIAPATANIIAKFATGIADDMLTSVVLATRAPVIVCPAMHHNMYTNPATVENLETLKKRGFTIIPAAHGRLASGALGYGRLPDTAIMMGTIEMTLGQNGDFKGKKIVVTAGGTQEAIDPVRFISNRSSGKMGYAVAEAARDRGAQVTLITAPTALPDPVGVNIVKIKSVVQLRDEVVKATQKADVLVMSAAGADFIPKNTAAQKIKKSDAGLALELVKAPDILSEIKDGKFIKVGFKAETQNLVDNAREKLYKTNLDLIVANDVTKEGSGFGTDTNEVTIISKDGKPEALPLMTKREVADQILDRVVKLLK